MDNVVLTPHIGSATIETRQAMGDLTVENLAQHFSEGKVTTPVPNANIWSADHTVVVIPPSIYKIWPCMKPDAGAAR